MARKHKCPDGVPEWIVTYGDMMSLLLCFFILLAAFSEPKKEREFQKVIQAIKEAFGYVGGAGYAPTDDSPTTSIIAIPDAVSLLKEQFKQVATADDPGVTGKQTTVQSIREGLQFRIGGFLTFEPGSAELKEQAKVELAKIAAEIRGKNNKVEIRGHASNNDLPPGSRFGDLWELSFARAQAARAFLTSPEMGIASQRVRVVACANNEPLIMRAYDPATVTVNRRIEVIITETLIQEFQDDSSRAQLPEVTQHGG
jgi:chemotaxis protein MotB